MNGEEPKRISAEDDDTGAAQAAEPHEAADETATGAGEPAPAPLNSATPPRILAETPIGGVRRPVVPARPPAEPHQPDSPAADEAVPLPVAESEAEEAPAPAAPEPESLAAEAPLPSTEDAPIPAEPVAAPPAPPAPEVSAARETPVAPERPSPADTAKEIVARTGEWDDDISPELAAVLFGSQRKPAAAAPTSAAPAASETVPAAPTAAETETSAEAAPLPPEPDAEPITLTDRADAPCLAITAEKRAAPAPQTALDGPARYVRVEEPIKGETGQHVVETWRYLKPDLPEIGGHTVKDVRREEWHYADGSWRWRYERRYLGGGRDRRDVRTNADSTYIERVDELAHRDPATGKRRQLRERAAMILAAPPHEEKRGLLNSLLGRDAGGDSNPATWHAAASSEAKHARKEGGKAFVRGFFASLFGG